MPRPAKTSPPTYTSGEVEAILKGEVTTVMLQRWDAKGIFRPSYYHSSAFAGGLVSRARVDDDERLRARKRGAPGRRFTYQDLVWLRLLMHVKANLESHGVPRATVLAGEVITRLREMTGGRCPPGWRLLFTGRRAYLLRDDGVAESLIGDKELAMSALLTDKVLAEVGGRIAVLEAHKAINSVPADDRPEAAA